MTRRIVNERILFDPEVCSGKPVINGTRIMVRNVLGIVAGGGTLQDVVHDFPELTEADVVAALEYAADIVDSVSRVPAGYGKSASAARTAAQ